jgi:hypothetical protein
MLAGRGKGADAAHASRTLWGSASGFEYTRRWLRHLSSSSRTISVRKNGLPAVLVQRRHDGLQRRYPCSEREKMRHFVVREPPQVEALVRRDPCELPARVRQRMVWLQSEATVSPYNAQGGGHLPAQTVGARATAYRPIASHQR